MRYEVQISEQAESDLRNIYEYIAYQLLAPNTASEQLLRLQQGIMNLNSMPERYRCYEEEPWYSRGLHVMPVDNFNVYYLIAAKIEQVTVMRVMYHGCDAETRMK